MREWRFLWRIAGQDRRWMALGTGVGLAAGVATVGLMAVGGGLLALCTLTGLAAAGAWNPAVSRLSAGIRLFAVGRTLGRYGERVLTHDATLRILGRVRTWFFTSLAPLAPGGLRWLRGGDLLDRLVADVDALTAFYLRVATPWASSLALVGGVAAFLAWLDPTLSLAATAGLVVATAGLPLLAGRWGRTHAIRAATRGRRLRIRLLESLQGRQELLVYGAATRQVEALEREGSDWLRDQARCATRVALVQALSILVAGAGVGLVLWLTTGALADRVGPTGLAAAVLAVITAFEVVAPLATAAPERERVREASARIESILDAPAVTPAPRDAAPCPTDATIRIEGLGFGYPDDELSRPALEGLDLTIPVGDHVAIFGPSGAGKSTLAQLLVRLRDPDAGRITLGGTDLRDLAESDLRRMVTAVEQRPHLFTGTLRDNLRLGRPDADDDALREVLATASLAVKGAPFPDGLDTWISGTGDPAGAQTARRLSGGEARRLCLARALLRDTPVLILDEPTGDLDPPTASALLASLLKSRRGRTLVLITHRRAALERVDRILHMESGQVIEDGDHATLLAGEGRYAGLWRRLGGG